MATEQSIDPQISSNRLRHGHAARKWRGGKASPEYKCWAKMKERCLNPNCPEYATYGGRGIKVCDRWLAFDNFLADMGARPGKEYSIDRYPNNDGNYEPTNCRWATRGEQNRNKRSRHEITFRGVTRCLEDWASHLGILQATLWSRLKTLNWTIGEALTIPVSRSNKKTTFRNKG